VPCLAPRAALIVAGELYRRLGDPALTIVDVRPLAAYNGWRLAGERRGGHIPGAVAFPAEWLASVDAPEVESVLHAKRVVPGREIVVYGDRRVDVSAFAAHLAAAGHARVRMLDDWRAWNARETLPLERLPNYEKLVHPAWLREVLEGGRPEAAPEGRHLLFHVNCGAPEEYEEGHLPQALYLDTNRLEDPVDWNRRSPEELDIALCSLGVTRDTTVILYGRDSEGDGNDERPGRRAGQIAAARAAMIMRYCGVDDVRLLDGGYDRWVRLGNPLETTPRRPEPVESFGGEIPLRPDVIVDLEEAKEILRDRDRAALVSVRTWREHIGEVSGYSYIDPAGRIAGDVWADCGAGVYDMSHYRNADNTMRAYPEIAANWKSAGITRDKRVPFYCGTGWRASETWFYAYLMGWPRIAVYDGGWFEWSRDPDRNPVEVGEPDAGRVAALA
jgi:molybdopterin synthase sulfurtransferase